MNSTPRAKINKNGRCQGPIACKKQNGRIIPQTKLSVSLNTSGAAPCGNDPLQRVTEFAVPETGLKLCLVMENVRSGEQIPFMCGRAEDSFYFHFSIRSTTGFFC